ncbi:conserved hypothetical protein [Chthoniobacter flavus Ellin428]|uniref:Trm112 family protein n=1 Tax=Chthoniobacter flavus Ellin428 TaxID=497964 RepID=B4D359_9BACT|nr:hypothetical protein [Chthoniobacter flavus]EDY19170.1 conserved hypothetical protein [Chthoniobacter flavus Ellin428]TCO88016.1 hypothetical protein EV701_11959 [Chthoniobacter flavus]
MITDELLALLRCPQTMQSLSLASVEQLAQIEAARAAGKLLDRSGRTVKEPILGGLVREDGALLFPIRDGIPVLLLDDALPLGAA